jgi:hypothetical protein
VDASELVRQDLLLLEHKFDSSIAMLSRYDNPLYPRSSVQSYLHVGLAQEPDSWVRFLAALSINDAVEGKPWRVTVIERGWLMLRVS